MSDLVANMANPKILSVEQWHLRFRQQASWTAQARRYLLEKADIQPGGRILEVGCGTGAVLGELADQGYLSFGIDIQIKFVEFFRKNYTNPAVSAADAYQLPFSSRTFDLVCCHYFLLWIQRPEQVIAEILRNLKPGGRFLIFAEPDYGGRIDHPPALEPLGRAQIESLIRQGADPFMGRKLAGLISAFPEFHLTEIGIMGYQADLVQNPTFWESEWQVLRQDIADAIPASELEALHEVDRSARRYGSRVLFVPTFFLYTEVKKEG